MLNCKSCYIRLIETRVVRAAKLAAGYGFTVEIKGSLLRILDRRSNATLLFRSDHIVVEQLGVDLRLRRHGYGSVMLDLIIAIANQADLRIELIAESPLRPNKADLSQNDLEAWYRRHQFVAADELLMSRLPDSKVARSNSRTWNFA
jgi:hypothetical protein